MLKKLFRVGEVYRDNEIVPRVTNKLINIFNRLDLINFLEATNININVVSKIDIISIINISLSFSIAYCDF
jgi:hypothetical protein